MTTVVEPEDGTIEERGLSLHYVVWGPSRAPGGPTPVVVLLHGLSAMCRIWDPLARALQERYRVIALDQRGHGDTSWPQEPNYTTDDYVGDLEALVERWELERFALVGLSMGGMNAIAYAARHPDRVTHLSVVDIRPAITREKLPTRQLDKSSPRPATLPLMTTKTPIAHAPPRIRSRRRHRCATTSSTC